MDIVTPEQVGLSVARLEHLRTVAQDYVDQARLAGLMTLVARRGKVAHFECYGIMDVEANKPMQPDTIFRIYSMTKPITCVAFMMLVEEGSVLLNDPVSKFIPEFRDLKVFVGTTGTGYELADLEREITIWHLLTHTAGLAYGINATDTPVEDMYRAAGFLDPVWQLRQSLPDMVQTLAELPLAHQPGGDWRYSMANDVIGYLVGVISGTPFKAFLAERVFEPLGMDDTGFFVPEEKLGRLAALYSAPGEGGISLLDAAATSPYSKPGNPPSGGGGLVSTAPDYLRFAQMLLNGGELDGVRLLTRETVQMMTTNRLPDDLVPIRIDDPWPGMGYGLGFGVVVDAAQTGASWSEGTFQWLGGGGTCFWVDPREELIGLIMHQARFYFDHLGPLVNLAYEAIVD
jgi:CubicO group peptidase (beta-lactamase class C family)